MLHFQDALKTYTQNKYAYSLELEKDDPYDHQNAYGSERGFALTFNGARHYLNVPAVQNFTLSCHFEHNKGFVVKRPIFWSVKFGYDKRTREGYEIELCRLADSDGTKISLYKTKSLKKELLKTESYPFVQKADTPYFFRLCVKGEKLDCYFATCHFNADMPPMKGKIAFVKGESFREIFITDIDFKTLELSPIESHIYRFILPTDNIPDCEFSFDLKLDDYGDGYQKATVVWGGGFWDKPVEKVIHTEDMWATTYANMQGMYFRLNNGERLYLFNNEKRIYPVQYGEAIQVVGEAHDVARSIYDVEMQPVERSFLLCNTQPLETVSVGYNNAYEHGLDFLATPREFVFDLQSNLLYNGKALDEEICLDVHSPISEEIANAIPKDAFKRDAILQHLTDNHYFTVNENAVFAFDLRTAKNTNDYTFNAYLADAFFKRLRGVTVENGDTPHYAFGNPQTKKVFVGKLPIGVYHLVIEVLYAGEKIYTHRSAFDIIDLEKDLSPRIASGIPPIHAQDGLLLGQRHCLPDPWLSIADCNIPHYIDIATYSPFDFEKQKPWEIQKILKRKTLVWATQRNATREEVMTGKLQESQMIANADFVNYPYPIIHESPNYYRFDFSEERLYADKNTGKTIHPMADILKEYLDLHPELRDELGLQEISVETLPREKYIEFLKRCHNDYLNFVLPKVQNALKEQWESEVKPINPNAKRQSYGPFPQYTSHFVGGYTGKWFGGETDKWHENFDGFMQYEDYPFVCDYSTTKGAWGMATMKFLCPAVQVSPELYDGFAENCPDSAIACARPPLGSFDAPPYMTVTQIHEYLYNSARYRVDEGKFGYWTIDGLMVFFVYNYHPQERWQTLMPALGDMRANMPKAPKKGVVCVYDIPETDDRFDGYNYHAFYNISDANMLYAYSALRENGVPVSHITDFKGLKNLTEEDCTALVLPALDHADEQTLKKIRALHAKGVALIAVSSVAGLEDLFGVQKATEFSPITSVVAGDKEEFVTHIDAEFFHKAENAEVLLKADNGNAVVTKHGNAVCLNAPVCQVGRDCVDFIYFNTSSNASALLKETLTNALLDIVKSPLHAEGKCGVTHFETQKGDDALLLIDYTADNRHELMEKTQRVLVRLTDVCYADIQGVTDDRKIGKVFENGKLTAFTLELAPQESFLLKFVK